MGQRLRVSHVVVQPVFVLDDGDELRPGPEVAPINAALSDLPALADAIRHDVALKQTELDDQAAGAAEDEASAGTGTCG
jgi:hypothetical protein